MDPESNPITTAFQVYCARYEEFPFVNQRRIFLNTGCQRVNSAGYLEQTPSGVSEGLEENPPEENPGLFYCPGESGRKLQTHKYYLQTAIYVEWAAHYMER